MNPLNKTARTRKNTSTLSYLCSLKGLRLMCILFVLFISTTFTVSFASAKAAGLDTSTFCSRMTSYAFKWHCQIGDKTYYGWYDKKTPKQVPDIARLKILNFNGNPGTGGKLVIYTPQLYCDVYWVERVGHGYVQINDERFATCPKDQKKLGNGGYNNGASYVFAHGMVRIITNIKVLYSQSILLKIYGAIYANIPDDCRSEKFFMCEYPGISPGWMYAYAKTGSHVGQLANFYRNYKFSNNKPIYDFLTINYGDMDLDVWGFDYYDLDDLQMTFGLLAN